jgi:phosphate transport system substrate-binding protein
MVFSTMILSCTGGNRQQYDSPTSGEIRIGVDDSYLLMMAAQLDMFHYFYKNAKVDTLVDAEANIINLFLQDSIEVMVVGRDLTPEQLQNLRDQTYNARSTHIAVDAVAFVLNKQNKHKNFYYDQIRDIFSGKITSWNQIDPKLGLGNLRIIFDKNGSSNINYFKDKFNLQDFPATFNTAISNQDVINYVENNIHAIGIVSVNWISDPADSISHNFLTRVQTAGISGFEGSNKPGEPFYQPYPYYIHDRSYPFTRDVYIIDRQTYSGLGHGLSAFIAGEKGQTIILQSGMVPAALPVRIVQFKQ